VKRWIAKGVAEIVQEQWAIKQRLSCPVPCATVAFALNHGQQHLCCSIIVGASNGSARSTTTTVVD
jgi:hypothetical protein